VPKVVVERQELKVPKVVVDLQVHRVLKEL
jgi:hypothetical protein